jgi:hypothetical protein
LYVEEGEDEVALGAEDEVVLSQQQEITVRVTRLASTSSTALVEEGKVVAPRSPVPAQVASLTPLVSPGQRSRRSFTSQRNSAHFDVGTPSSVNTTGISPIKQRKVQEALLMQGHTIESLRNKLSGSNTFVSSKNITSNNPTEVVPPSTSGTTSNMQNVSRRPSLVTPKSSSKSFRPSSVRRMAYGPKSPFFHSYTTGTLTGSPGSKDTSTSSTTKPRLKGSVFSKNPRKQTSPSLKNGALLDVPGQPLSVSHNASSVPSYTTRRYKVGDNVLICIASDSMASHATRSSLNKFVCYVNQYGFLPDDPSCLQDRDYYGPYQYVIASVQQVHYEEIHPYYTVLRYDSDLQQRANLDQMEPLATPEGELAAKRDKQWTSAAGSSHQ